LLVAPDSCQGGAQLDQGPGGIDQNEQRPHQERQPADAFNLTAAIRPLVFGTLALGLGSQ
jgi:hypothetical protein